MYGRATNTAVGIGYGVRGDSSTVSGRGVRGIASGSSGVGVHATATGTRGIGLLGESRATSGSTTGVYGTAYSANGTAGRFDNFAGGKILSLRHSGVEEVAVLGNGNLGIGTSTPQAQLHISGGQWNVTDTNGDFKIGNNTYQMRMGIAVDGFGAGDFRLRSVGGTNRTILGGGSNDVLAVTSTAVGVGTITPNEKLTVNTPGGNTPVGAVGVDVQTFGTIANAGSSYFFRARDLGAAATKFLIDGLGNTTIFGNLSMIGGSVLGGLRINGDRGMNSNPRMVFSGFINGSFEDAGFAGGFFIPDKAITVTRVTARLGHLANGCTTHAQVVIVGFSPEIHLDVPNGVAELDSGPIAVTYPAGANLTIFRSPSSGCSAFSAPADAFVNVEYAMQ